MIWRLIPYQVGDSAWNIALDEALFIHYLKGLSPPTLRFYGWNPPTLSIGYFQDLAKEVNIRALEEHGFGLVRRNTGGRAVLHDRELTYAVVAGSKDGLPNNLKDSYLYISRAFVEAFTKFGVQAELHQGPALNKTAKSGACFEAPSWYELTVAGRKLVGSAQMRNKESFLQHGSILLDFIVSNLTEVLMTDPASALQLDRSLEERVTSFKKLGVEVTVPDLVQAIKESFNNLYQIGFQIGAATTSEVELAENLVVTKYANQDWNNNRGRQAELANYNF